MKKIAGILMICATFVAFGFTSPKSPEAGEKMVTLTVGYTFSGIVDGYDHMNKSELYVDGKLVATSSVKEESKPNSVSATVTKGSHNIKVLNYAMYEGEWEVHSIANNYSQDCMYEANVNCKKKNTKIKLLFDLDNGTKLVK